MSRRDGGPLSSADVTQAAGIVRDLAASHIEGVAGVVAGPSGLAPNRTVAIGTVLFTEPVVGDGITPAVRAVRDRIHDLSAGGDLEAGLTGEAAAHADAAGQTTLVELVSTAVAVLLMLLIFRSPLIAVANLVLVALVGEVAGGGDGREHLERALPLLGRGAPYPWCSIQALTSLGATAVAGHELELAASLLGRARRELTRYPDAGVLPRALARAERRLEEARGGAGVLRDPLTAAEMRVLELLPTYLRVDEIREALHLSKSTIKSHLGAIYRKLGVCRRSDAVISALRHGILDAHG